MNQTLTGLRALLDDSGLRNRLINLPDRPDPTGAIFVAPARAIQAALESRDLPLLGQGCLTLTRDARDRFFGALGTIAKTERQIGVPTLALGLGIARWRDGSTHRRAPLLVVPVRVLSEGVGYRLSPYGDPTLNAALLARVGILAESFPDNALDYVARITDAIVGIEDIAVLGQFGLARHEMFARTDPEMNPRIVTAGALAGITAGPAMTSAAVSAPEDPSSPLDRQQRAARDQALSGINTIILGGAGTGKVRIADAILKALAIAGRRALVISETVPTLERLSQAHDEGAEARVNLWSPDQARAFEDESGRRPTPSTIQILRSYSRAQRPHAILTTPLGYATYVPAEWRFDCLLVIDGGRVATEHAILALSVCEQGIVLGDEWQSPPNDLVRQTFDTQVTSSPRDSLLAAAIKGGWDTVRLTKGYRARHHHLLWVTNRHIYRPSIDVIPAAGGATRNGVNVHHVEGLFDRRNGEINAIEAESAAADAVRSTALHPDRTIAVVGMTRGQTQRIADEIDHLKSTAGTDTAQISVRSYDECAGIEVDEMILSLTYGPDRAGGSMPKAFGALSLPGGDKILTTLMTRSRYATRIYTSVPSEMVPRNRGKGHEMLITLLKGSDDVDPRKPYLGPGSDLITELGCHAQRHDHVLYLTERTGRILGAILLVDGESDTDAICETGRLRHAGWLVETLPRHVLDSADSAQAGRSKIASCIANLKGHR